MYVDAWYFHKDWEETTLREEIRKLFENLLKNSSGEDIGYVTWTMCIDSINTDRPVCTLIVLYNIPSCFDM